MLVESRGWESFADVDVWTRSVRKSAGGDSREMFIMAATPEIVKPIGRRRRICCRGLIGVPPVLR